MPGAQCGIDGDMLGTATPAQLTVKAYSGTSQLREIKHLLENVIVYTNLLSQLNVYTLS